MTTTREYIEESEIDVAHGARPWRAASGKICRGKPEDKESGTPAVDYEERTMLTGYPTEIGVRLVNDSETGELTEKRVYVVLDTQTGPETFHVTFWKQPKRKSDGDGYRAFGQFHTFVGGLAQVPADTQIVLTANLGKQDPKSTDNKPPTYVNVSKAIRKGEPRVDYRGERLERTEDNEIDFAARLATLEGHPLWKGESKIGEKSEADEGGRAAQPTNESQFWAMIEKKGWPGWKQAKNGWTAIFNQVGAEWDGETADSVGEDQYRTLLENLSQRKEMPKALVPFVKAEGYNSPGKDPFEDL